MTSEQPPAANEPVLPPYEGRRETADVDPASEGEVDGVGVGGARRPTEAQSGLRQDERETSPRGAVASPADEQPAADQPETRPDEGSTGPAHQAGVPKGEEIK